VFAAEFLAPAELIQSRLAGRETTREEMDEIAYMMGVSSYVVAHQVQNHGLAVVRDDLQKGFERRGCALMAWPERSGFFL
jgi:Zn-dependent peptidase ImmA (M78 family)